ncbi:sensor histidine kinase [Desulfocastanea catecholica]
MPDSIIADRLAVTRIYRNIIENALKYGGDGLGKIEIGYRFTDELHIFTVADDGQGVTEEVSRDIFNWFKRKKHTSTPESGGAGISLAIVREIAATLGGAVWQEPAKPKGVTFCVSLSRSLLPGDITTRN